MRSKKALEVDSAALLGPCLDPPNNRLPLTATSPNSHSNTYSLIEDGIILGGLFLGELGELLGGGDYHELSCH